MTGVQTCALPILLVLLGLAVIVSLAFRHRAFCSYVCPIGHLLGIYALFSPIRWGVHDRSICDNCTTHDCISKKNQEKLFGRSCTSGLFAPKIKDDRTCLVCTQCAKSCPYGNPGPLLNFPPSILCKPVRFTSAQTVFILVLAGFVVYEILSEWAPSKAILTWVPIRVTQWMGVSHNTASFLNAGIMFVVYPMVFALNVVVWERFFTKANRTDILDGLLHVLLPAMAAGHIIKSMIKMSTRLPYIPHVLSDPQGMQTAIRLQTGELNLSVINAIEPLVTASSIIVLIAAMYCVSHIIKKSPVIKGMSYTYKAVLWTAATFYWLVFAITIVLWRL